MKKDYKWEEILRNSITENNTIKAIELQHIPKLKDCDNWDEVFFLGRVKYQFKLTKMDGGIVRKQGKIYYVNAKQIMALSSLYKWNTSKMIKVIE